MLYWFLKILEKSVNFFLLLAWVTLIGLSVRIFDTREFVSVLDFPSVTTLALSLYLQVYLAGKSLNLCIMIFLSLMLWYVLEILSNCHYSLPLHFLISVTSGVKETGNLEKFLFYYNCWPEAIGKCTVHCYHTSPVFKSVLIDFFLLVLLW